MTSSVNGCSVLTEIKFVGTRLWLYTTQVSSAGGFHSPTGAARERSDLDIKPLLWTPLLIFTQCYLLKSFQQGDTSARQQGSEIRVFPLPCELPDSIKPHLLACQLYCWQLGPNEWSSPATKSLDPIIVTALWVGFPREGLVPATCVIACNCPVP